MLVIAFQTNAYFVFFFLALCEMPNHREAKKKAGKSTSPASEMD
jgi:hypothetical protein